MGKTENKRKLELFNSLRKAKKPFWNKIMELLSRTKARKVEVNVSKIDSFSKEGETVIIPGKVLGSGKLTKPVVVAAFNFSSSAKKMIESAGGKALSIEALLEKNTAKTSEFKILI
jgi:large subunit ribosomal protein L18e